MSATFGGLIAKQVERSKSKQMVVVHLSATLPGDGSVVNVDWWLREMNVLLKDTGIQVDYTDLDAQSITEGQSSPIRVTQLLRKIQEQQAYITDLEENMREKAAAMAEQMTARESSALSPKEAARRSVEQDGFYVDARGSKWVDIASEAKRIGKSYISLWRAAKGIGIHRIDSMVVGTTQANGDRILVKQGSFSAGKRRKKGQQ